ncbi:VWA domain-containing protein [Ancylobacter sp. Lp-2]|uniref:VWA domain-containing protein n=1 Tax=Ancylobacter sp. Lp-2 TaxID=2881339 RepID=UPI001E3CE4FA|nr:VWA domain-containing protein [Ancylobacter sp. Lp-2]MCB4768417.1 VWA domain-containing protein [Ancylobacter sp. Lp-2]
MATDRHPTSKPPVTGPKIAPSTAPAGAAVNAFLAEVAARSPMPGQGRGRLIFALDATMSRQPTWDLACTLQAGMFDEAAAIGGLDMQLVYYRGLQECRSSSWVGDGRRLGELMARIDCRGGRTQIGRVLAHAGNECERGRVGAVVFVGDAMEEALDDLCAKAGPLALRGVPVFLFQEGRDPVAERGFREIARLTGGAWCRFDAGAAEQLAALLRAAARYAAGGQQALTALAKSSPAARQLLAAMSGPHSETR